ncbi:MAG: glycosyltransferase family 39 protein [Methanomicrobium sp.]|nr:glycosyltransferase family 39 protein [Methanomicrobium sp.]
MKSKSNFLKKLSSAYPFNYVLSFPTYTLGSLFILFFIIIMLSLSLFKDYQKLNGDRKNNFNNKIKLLINKKSLSNIYLPVLLFIIAFVWRLYHINTFFLGCDCAFTIFHSQESAYDILTLPASGEANPPLFMFLLHFWIKLFGISIYSVRILPILFSSLTVVFIYFSGKKISGVSTGILASGIYILSAYNISFGMDVRAYSLLSMLTAASLYFFLSLISNNVSKRNLLLLIISNSLLIYTHYLGWFIIGMQFLTGLIYLKNRKIFKSIIISIIITCVAYAPMFPIIIKQYFISVKDYHRQYLLNLDFSEYLFQISSLLNSKPVFFIIIFILLAGIINVLFINKSRKKIPRNIIVIFLWWFVPFTFMFLITKKVPIFLDKYLLFNSIGLYLFIGYSINLMFKSMHARVLGALFLIFMFSQIDLKFRHYNHSEVQKSVNEIKKKYDNRVIVIFNSFFKYQFMYYYDQNIFRDYENFNSLLYKNKILPVDDLNEAKEGIKKLQKTKFIITPLHGPEIKSFELDGNRYLHEESFFYVYRMNIRVFRLENSM